VQIFEALDVSSRNLKH